MKPFFIDENYFEIEYNKLLTEMDIFDFSAANTLVSGFDQIGSNVPSAINSLHDTCEYFCNSFVCLKYAYKNLPYTKSQKKNYYWVFYYHNIALHFLHTIHDLLFILVRELTQSYEVKLELGFRKKLVKKLRSSDDENFKKLGNALNKNSPIRTLKYRDEYTHNITPYRLNSHPEKNEHGITFLKLVNQ
ncbi:Cthe_2314 family HEPN domain-containing protein [Staphylococcus intermedius]|uniref:Cthe-2314-like HEPN domain-containing protein n=3 Tax=Staphylococcus intermedius TaxID=1285 RepID=A0A380G2P1_STAIN|nr:Cthe_2314 family HEPN domain-containing protein [Staphylococcus intermedius]PCF64239.1 hypothetical protein B5C04_09720 [Staphylococcus intermedius]PCF78955.1 hypothetical protein B4W74_10070 [Staphylococcus intermedius]PCF79927.1 hypothetical protein B4W70_09710 [Staphylococcus intermedius]PCF89413.1 hypothetical protein B4W75_00835 [Staphylococcus intermedius]SUM45439.1 Uncharacterised protein [Staphylococcus intermedius NCTC 11048]